MTDKTNNTDNFRPVISAGENIAEVTWKAIILGIIISVLFGVANAYLGRSSNLVPHSMLLTVLAGLYIGYPFWGYALGRRLLSSRRDSEQVGG